MLARLRGPGAALMPTGAEWGELWWWTTPERSESGRADAR